MQDFYPAIKNFHMSLAMLSLAGFLFRGWWSIQGSALLQQRWIKVVPHIVDTLLLTSAILLMIILNQHLAIKVGYSQRLLLYFFYIGFGTLAIKRAPTPATKLIFFALAIATFAYIVGVAIAHHPASWFELI